MTAGRAHRFVGQRPRAAHELVYPVGANADWMHSQSGQNICQHAVTPGLLPSKCKGDSNSPRRFPGEAGVQAYLALRPGPTKFAVSGDSALSDFRYIIGMPTLMREKSLRRYLGLELQLRATGELTALDKWNLGPPVTTMSGTAPPPMTINANARSVDTVLFDLYGTLLDIRVDEDSAALWAGLTAALTAAGANLGPGDVRSWFQSILKDEAERGREGFIMELVFRRLLASLRVIEDVGRIGRLFRQLSLKEQALRPYVVPLLEALHRSGSKTGIVSNTEAVLTRFDLDCFPTLRTVGAIVLSSDIGVRKPDPQIFQVALERLHSEPASAVFIGNDWAADIAGARHSGLRAIYLDGRACDRAPVAANADGAVLYAAPTLEAIVSALCQCGWHGEERRSVAPDVQEERGPAAIS